MAALVPHIAAAAKMPEAQLKELIKNGSAKRVSERPGTVHFSLSFGGEEALRSVVKSALVLWSLAVGNDEVRSPVYAEARAFVVSGGDFNARRMHLDSRPVPNAETLTDRFGTFFNLLYVASDAHGRVVAHFTLYNLIGWQMVLAEAGGTPDLRTAIVNNPLDPGEWSDAIAAEAAIPFEWLASPGYGDNFTRAQDRISSMMQKHLDDARKAEWDRIIRAVLDKHGLVEGSVINDPKLIHEISRDIAHRVASHVFSIPYSEQIEPEELANLLDEK